MGCTSCRMTCPACRANTHAGEHCSGSVNPSAQKERGRRRSHYVSYRSYLSHDDLSPASRDKENSLLADVSFLSRLTFTPERENSVIRLMGPPGNYSECHVIAYHTKYALCVARILDTDGKGKSHSPLPDAHVPQDATVYSYFTKKVTQYHERIAMTDTTTKENVTYKELLRSISSTSRGLAEHGFSTGHVLCLISSNCSQWATLFFAVASLGGVFTCLDPHIESAGEIWEHFQNTKTNYVVTSSCCFDIVLKAVKTYGKVKSLFVLGKVFSKEAVNFEEAMEKGCDKQLHHANVRPISPQNTVILAKSRDLSDVQVIARISHHNVVAAWTLLTQAGVLAGTHRDGCVMGAYPFHHMFGLITVLGVTLVKGCHLLIAREFDTMVAVDLIKRYKITMLPLLPCWLGELARAASIKDGDDHLPEVQGTDLVVYGQPQLMIAASLYSLKQRGWNNVTLVYGKVETCGIVAVDIVTGKYNTHGAVLLPNTEIWIRDTINGGSVGRSDEGEIWVKGPQVTTGYVGGRWQTNRVTDKGWLNTGDLGYVDSTGILHLYASATDIIRYKQYMIHCKELEELLMYHEGVEDAAVVGIRNPLAGQVPRAIVVKNNDQDDLKASTLLEYVNESVPFYQELRGGLAFVDSIPRSECGRTLACALQEMDMMKIVMQSSPRQH